MKKKWLLLFILLAIGVTACGKQNTSMQTDNVQLENDEDSEQSEVEEKTEKETTEEIVEDTQKIDISAFDFSDLYLGLECTYELREKYPEGCVYDVEKDAIATIIDGKLVAHSEGKAKVTVTYEGQSKQFQLCVTNPQMSITEVNKIVGRTVNLSVYGTSSEIEWESDNDSIATVENGIVTAMPTGCGMSTQIHAYVDGKDLICQINVEPIPQLDTTYKLYSEGYIRSTIAGDYACNLTAYSNTNQIIRYTENQMADPSAFGNRFSSAETVMNLGKVDYSDGRTFAVYETYMKSTLGEDDYTHIEIYLVGTSQDADVMAKSTHGHTMEVSYEAQDGYGIISVWSSGRGDTHVGLVYVEVDGLEYCFGIQDRGGNLTNASFLPKSDTLIEYTEDGKVKANNEGGYSSIMHSSYTFIPTELTNELTEKFIDTLQDKAISTCVDMLFKIIF